MFSAVYKSLSHKSLPDRFSTSSLSETYKSPFRQALYFLIYTKGPGVTASAFHWQPLGGSARAPSFSPFSAKSNLSLAVPKNATYNLSPSASGANHGRRQKKQIAEIRRQDQQSQWQPKRQARRQN